MILDDLATPCVVIEHARLVANLEAMQAKADAQGVALRPHTKTHKSVTLARMQQTHGAQGLTVAKVGEAEVLAAAGFKDLRIAYETIGLDKHERIGSLLKDGVRVSFCVDSRYGASEASTWYASQELNANVLIEIDVGYGRTGVRWDDPDLVDFAHDVAALPGLRLVGILTHAGHSYKGPQEGETHADALRRVANLERDRMLAVATQLKAAGIPDLAVSIGSTPSMRYFENRTVDGCRITEIRPGNYVFHDAIQQALGVADWDQCALSVLATVISKHRDTSGQERLFLDAGKKVLTSDGGYGLSGYGQILYNARTMTPLPHATITGLSEEHGWVQVRGGATMNIGDRVRVVPNHACTVVNTQQQVHIVDGEEVIDTWTVDSQSRVQ